MFRLYDETTAQRKDNFLNKFHCATCRALRSTVLCSVVKFVVQLYLRGRENIFNIAIYCKYIEKYIL